MTSLVDNLASVDLVAQAGGAKVAYSSWTDAVRRNVSGFRFDCDRPRAFQGAISNCSLAGVNFFNMACDKHAAYRDQETISAAADSAYYVMSLQLSGELRMAQDGRLAVLKPGLFAIYDASRPATLVSSDDYRSTGIKFPKDQLGARYTEPMAAITATTFECAPGLPAAVWGMLLTLNTNLTGLGSGGRTAVRGVLDLVSVMLRTELERRGLDGGDRNEDLLDKVREYIDDHLSDPGLGPDQIAAAHYISPRSLHKLFEQTNHTVAAWVRTRRVEQCRRDLADPQLVHIPVAAIATRWGLRGASHFGQVFKRETGLTPAEFRRQAIADRSRSALG